MLVWRPDGVTHVSNHSKYCTYYIPSVCICENYLVLTRCMNPIMRGFEHHVCVYSACTGQVCRITATLMLLWHNMHTSLMQLHISFALCVARINVVNNNKMVNGRQLAACNWRWLGSDNKTWPTCTMVKVSLALWCGDIKMVSLFIRNAMSRVYTGSWESWNRR